MDDDVNNQLTSFRRQLPVRTALISRGLALAESLLEEPGDGPVQSESQPHASIQQPADWMAEHLRQAREHLDQASRNLNEWHAAYPRQKWTSAAIFTSAIDALISGYYAALLAIRDAEPTRDLTQSLAAQAGWVRESYFWLDDIANAKKAQRAEIEHRLWHDRHWSTAVDNLAAFISHLESGLRRRADVAEHAEHS